MFFITALLIVGISCIAITYKTLVGYGNFSYFTKIGVLLLLLAAWFSPMFLRILRQYLPNHSGLCAICSQTAYFLMGYAFILVMLLLARDFIWYIIYFISRNPNLNPNNAELLNYSNLWTLLICLVISVYGVYEATKTPAVKEYVISDPRILQDTKIVIASDLHIDQAKSMRQIEHSVDTINAQKPDYILLVGDIIDNVPASLEKKIEPLNRLKAEKIYVSLGNHEYYNNPTQWMIKFTEMGFNILHNSGETVEKRGLYIAGVPDAHSAAIDFEKAGQDALPSQYKILMSHSPTTANMLKKDQFDLQVSGHTHGGQIFPFNFLAEKVNGYLAGMYNVNGNRLYVSRGAGYWGPPLRIFAPSDITVIRLKGNNNDKQTNINH